MTPRDSHHELIEALEAYLLDTRQIHPLAARQARVLGGLLGDAVRGEEARAVLLITLLALGRGAPRATKEFLLKPLARDVVERYSAAYRAENDDETPAWDSVMSHPRTMKQCSAFFDGLFSDPGRLAPVSGAAPGRHPAPYPLLVVEQSRVGFSRYWQAASLLEERLRDRLRNDAVPAPGTAAIVASLFGADTLLPDGRVFHYRQAAAAALALRSPFLVLSGGPGTGKTSVVIQILRALLRAFPTLAPDRMVLCAPTGRAKARLGESIDDGVALLDERQGSAGTGGNDQDRSLARVQRTTLHGLLSGRPDGSMKYHAGNPLPHQVVVVDEASMVDLCLFAGLLDAAVPSCRIILVGDMHQLPSVDAGAVLGDLTERFNDFAGFPTVGPEAGAWLASALSGLSLDGSSDASMELKPREAAAAGQLADRVVILTKSYRSSREILDLAALVNGGGEDEALGAIVQEGSGAVTLDTREGLAPVREWLEAGHDAGRLKSLAALRGLDAAGVNDPAARGALDAAFVVLNESRILTLAHGGPRGRIAINAMADRQLRSKLDRGGTGRFFHGQPVILNRNHHELDLYNGDTGMVLQSSDGGLKILFHRGRHYTLHALDRLTDIEPAFAITVHKAQGSEFDAVLLVLPEYESPLLSRQVIYTGMTRARKRVVILGAESRLRQAIRNREERSGGIGI